MPRAGEDSRPEGERLGRPGHGAVTPRRDQPDIRPWPAVPRRSGRRRAVFVDPEMAQSRDSAGRARLRDQRSGIRGGVRGAAAGGINRPSGLSPSEHGRGRKSVASRLSDFSSRLPARRGIPHASAGRHPWA